jgi:hypothetical protein
MVCFFIALAATTPSGIAMSTQEGTSPRTQCESRKWIAGDQLQSGRDEHVTASHPDHTSHEITSRPKTRRKQLKIDLDRITHPLRQQTPNHSSSRRSPIIFGSVNAHPGHGSTSSVN